MYRIVELAFDLLSLNVPSERDSLNDSVTFNGLLLCGFSTLSTKPLRASLLKLFTAVTNAAI